jgi:hypothetical protein
MIRHDTLVHRAQMDVCLWPRLLGHGDFVGVPGTLASSRMDRGSVAQVICRGTCRSPGQGGDQ